MTKKVLNRQNIRAPQIKIQITQEIIDRACRADSRLCPIALALKEAMPTATSIAVDLQTIRFSDPKRGLRYAYLTPRVAQTFLVYYDRAMPAKPVEFSIRGAVVTSRQTGVGAARRRTHKLGRRKVVSRKKGPVDLVGGRGAIPHHHASYSNRRQFGLKSFTLEDVVPVEGGRQIGLTGNK